MSEHRERKGTQRGIEEGRKRERKTRTGSRPVGNILLEKRVPKGSLDVPIGKPFLVPGRSSGTKKGSSNGSPMGTA